MSHKNLALPHGSRKRALCQRECYLYINSFCQVISFDKKCQVVSADSFYGAILVKLIMSPSISQPNDILLLLKDLLGQRPMRSQGTKAKKPAAPLALLAMKKERFKQVTHIPCQQIPKWCFTVEVCVCLFQQRQYFKPTCELVEGGKHQQYTSSPQEGQLIASPH